MGDLQPRGRLDDAEALELLEHGDLLELGAAADAVRRRLHSDQRRHLHRRPQHQLHRLLRLGLPLLRLLQDAGQRRGLPAGRGRRSSAKIEETLALGGTRHHDAGRPAPRPRRLLVREALLRHQAALPDPPPLALAARDRAHRRAQRPDRGRDAAPPAGRRARLAARRRRRDPRRPRARRDQSRTRSARGAGSTSCARRTAGHEDDGDHDVRLARHAGRARRAPAPHPRPAGRDRRLHGLHPLDLPGRQHGPRRKATCRPPAATTCGCWPSAASISTTSPTSRPRGSPRARSWARSHWPSAPTTWARR